VKAVHDVGSLPCGREACGRGEPETRVGTGQRRCPDPAHRGAEDDVATAPPQRSPGEDGDVGALRDELPRQLVQLPLRSSPDVRPAVGMGEQDADGELQRESVLSMLSRGHGLLS